MIFDHWGNSVFESAYSVPYTAAGGARHDIGARAHVLTQRKAVSAG